MTKLSSMRLLFDENISLKLVKDLAAIFSDSVRVREIGMNSAVDQQIWDHTELSDIFDQFRNFKSLKIRNYSSVTAISSAVGSNSISLAISSKFDDLPPFQQ